MMTTMVVNSRTMGDVRFGAALGQDPRGKIFRNYSDADKRGVAQDAISRINDVDQLVGILRFIEYLVNSLNKGRVALKGAKAALDEVSKAPENYDREAVNVLQFTVDYLRKLTEGISGLLSDDIDVPRDSFLVTAGSVITAGIIPTTFPTKLQYLWTELLNQIPARLGAKLVVERWTGPALSKNSEQQFEAVEFAPPGEPKTIHILSDGARTSFLEDAKVTEGYAAEMESSLKDAKILAAVQAIPWFVRALGFFVTREVAKQMSKRALLSIFALARYSFTIKGAITLTSVAALAKLSYEVMFSDIIPRFASEVGKALIGLAEAAANIMGAAKESTNTIVVIAGVAIGITLIGGAIVLVTK